VLRKILLRTIRRGHLGRRGVSRIREDFKSISLKNEVLGNGGLTS